MCPRTHSDEGWVCQVETDSRSKFGNDENEPHCRMNSPHVIAVRSAAIYCAYQVETDSRNKFGNDENERHCCANAPHVIAVRTFPYVISERTFPYVIAGRSPAIYCAYQVETDSRNKFGNDDLHTSLLSELSLTSLLCEARQSIAHTRLKQIPEASSGMTISTRHCWAEPGNL